MAGRQAASIRWTYPAADGGASLVPAMQMLGFQKIAEAYLLTSHYHEEAWEFVYLDQGQVTWEVEGGGYYPTAAGQWFYTRPGERHRARFDHMEPSKIWWMILEDPEAGGDWFGLGERERALVARRLVQLPRVFRADGGRAREQLARLRATLETADPDGGLFARHQALDIVLGLLQTTANVRMARPDHRETIARLVERMAQAPDERLSVAQMARDVRVSTPHFHKLFQELYGLAPSDYMERLRMERACALLRTSRSITDIALDLGYKTSQHFSTVFKKLIGTSPNEWRKENADQA